MSKYFNLKQMNWPTFIFTVTISVGSGYASYLNAIAEIKQQIAISQNDQAYLRQNITDMKDNIRDQKTQLDDIKSILITKSLLNDLKSDTKKF